MRSKHRCQRRGIDQRGVLIRKFVNVYFGLGQLAMLVIITFRVIRRRREMYSGHGRLCLSVPRRIPTLLHGPDVTWGNGMGCPLVAHYCADLRSLHGFRCSDNIALNAKCQRVLVLALCLVISALVNMCFERTFGKSGGINNKGVSGHIAV